MNKLKNIFRPTRIAKKLVRQIAIVTAVCLALSLCLSYGLFWPRLRDSAHDSAASTSRYIMQLINDAVTGLSGYADYMVGSESLSAAIEAYEAHPDADSRNAVKETLTSLSTISSNIRAVVLRGADGVFFQSDGLLGPEDQELLKSTWFSELASGKELHTWSSLYTTSLGREESTLVRVVSCPGGTQTYALCLFYNADGLMRTIDTLAAGIYTGYMITDSHDGIAGVPFYQTGEISNAQAVADAHLADTPYSGHDRTGHYFVITIPANQWILAGFIDMATFNSSFTPFLWLLLLICLILMALTFLLLVPAVNHLLAPIGELGETMKAVAHEGDDFYSHIQTDDEIGELSDIFNDMLDELRINAERELEQEKTAQRMSYSLMVAQINSHFFYNTMSTINSLARQGRTEDVVRANTALTAIFQDCLRPQSLRAGDTVLQEKAIVECYWVIETLDPANEGVLQWDISDRLMEKRIPKNIIQPLVENALFHGLDDAETGKKRGWIRISMTEEQDELVLTVSNNGAPIAPEMLEKLNQPGEISDGRQHIGLANIRRRLALLYGDRASLVLSSGGETAVTIRMPEL